MNKEVVYAINEVVSKLNELRSDMREFIGAVRQQNRPHSQFQQAQPFQPQVVFDQQPQMIFGKPYGYNGTPPLSNSISGMISLDSCQMIIWPIPDSEIASRLCTSRNEFKELSIVIRNIEVDNSGNQVTIIMEYPSVNGVPDLAAKVERWVHYMYTTLFGVDRNLIIRYNNPIPPPATTYR